MNVPIKLDDNRGFSLIELMVVVSIVGLLVSISIPRFYKLKASAYRAEVSINVNAMYTLGEARKLELIDSDPTFGTRLVWYGPVTYLPSTDASMCTPNEFGFSTTNCSKRDFCISVIFIEVCRRKSGQLMVWEG